jgi:hypothetical protein
MPENITLTASQSIEPPKAIDHRFFSAQPVHNIYNFLFPP